MSTRTDRIHSSAQVSTILIAIVLVCAAMREAQSVMAPTLLALVIGVVLSPLSDLWERIGLPRFLSALVSLVIAILVIFVLAALTLPVVERIASAWPRIMGEMRETIAAFQSALQNVETAGAEMREALDGVDDSGAAAAAAAEEPGSLGMPTTTDALFLAPAVAGQTITFAGILFFFLMTRRELYDFIARRIAPRNAEREIAERLLTAERQVARYFLTITLVNLGFGVATAIAMTAVGMPAPILWGSAVFVLNYVLYLGPAIVAAALLVGGLVAFDGAYSFVPSLAFVGLNLIEAQFVTPTAIGRTLSINPLVVFFTLVFFLWLWGPLGGFIAIPLILWVMVISNEIRDHRGRTLSEQADADAA